MSLSHDRTPGGGGAEGRGWHIGKQGLFRSICPYMAGR
jgi:hypothetical protein